MKTIRITRIAKYFLSAFALLISLLLLLASHDLGFEYIFLLPLAFSICSPILFSCMEHSKLTLFFYAFYAISFLRYTVSPLLLALTGEYIGPMVRVVPAVETYRKATFLMVYELFIVSIFFLFIYYIDRRQKNPLFTHSYKKYSISPDEIILTQNHWIYYLLFGATFVSSILFPNALQCLSFFSFGMTQYDISKLTFFEQATTMLIICTKFFLFLCCISKLKRVCQKSSHPRPFIEFLAFVVTLLFGSIYYSHNRAQFLFGFISCIYIYLLLFPKYKKMVTVLAVSIGIPILLFMTEERNYLDYYEGYNFIIKSIFSLSDTITAYFGGLGNVAVSIEMKNSFIQHSTFLQFIKDLTIPIVGINKLLPFDNELISNTLFNYQFYGNTNLVVQILPSIGHGYFYFGFLLAPIIDVLQLLIVLLLYKTLQNQRRIELIYLFNIVLFRFSILFGQNITQQINGLSIQLMLPGIIYYINNQITIKSKLKT